MNRALLMKRTLCLPLLILLSPALAHAQEGLESHIPTSDVPEFLFDHLDIATFRSSSGPKRDQGDRTLSSISPPPTTVTTDYIEVLEDDWVRRLTIVDRGDFNKDGIEDLAVCFDDRAIGGTYRSTQLLLVTRYTASSPAVALNYRVESQKARESCLVTTEG